MCLNQSRLISYQPNHLALLGRYVRWLSLCSCEEYLSRVICHLYSIVLQRTLVTGQKRVRHCTLTFYMEDSTVDVREPRQENSGIVQGQGLTLVHFSAQGDRGCA